MDHRGEYRSIHTVLVDSPEFMDLNGDSQLVWFHLKLRLGPSGIDSLPGIEQTLQETANLSLDAIRDAIGDLIRNGWLRRERTVLWLRNGLRFDPSLSLTNQNHRKGIQKHISALPKVQLVNDFAAYYDLEPPFPNLSHGQSHTPSHPPSHVDAYANQGKGEGKGKGIREEVGDKRTMLDKPSGPALAIVRAPTPTTALELLSDWMGEGASNLEGVRPLVRDLDYWAKSVWGLYGPNGTRERQMHQLAEEDRPKAFSEALLRFVGEAQRWDDRFFRSILESVIRGWHQEDVGDEEARDAERRVEARRRATKRGMEEAEAKTKAAEKEEADLLAWLEGQEQGVQDQIRGEAESRARTLSFAGLNPTPMMVHASLIGAIREARAGKQPVEVAK